MTMILDGTNGAFLPTWTTATRPASPANGEIGYNSTTGQLDQYVGSAWSSVPTSSATQATATALGTAYAKQTTGGGTPFLNAFGYNALASNSTGSSNTAVGYNALTANDTGGYNTAVGALALQTNAGAGEYNNAFGWQALKANTIGNENQAFGISALLTNTTGNYNTAIGSNALRFNLSTSNNTAVGYQAGYYLTGAPNTAIGSQALKGVSGTSTGSNNVAVGDSALAANTSGYYNVAVGSNTFSALTTGAGNTVIGEGAGATLATANNNTYVGQRAAASGSAVAYEIVIGCNITGKGSSTGYIGGNSNAVYQGNNSSTWSTTSDRRLKKNIVDNTVGLEAINAIQVRNFEYRTEDEVTDLPKSQVIKKEGVQLGVIAQELQQVLPDCVKEETTGVLSVDSSNLTWHMINAIKELNAEITALKAKVGI